MRAREKNNTLLKGFLPKRTLSEFPAFRISLGRAGDLPSVWVALTCSRFSVSVRRFKPKTPNNVHDFLEKSETWLNVKEVQTGLSESAGVSKRILENYPAELTLRFSSYTSKMNRV